MGLCDASTVDWEAIGALGTWAVGIAAIFLAYQANSFAKQLRRSNDERDKRTVEATISGLQMEIMHYARILEWAADRLEILAQERKEETPNRGRRVLEGVRNARLSAPSNLGLVLATVPAELGQSISKLHSSDVVMQRKIENDIQFLNTYKTSLSLDVAPRQMLESAIPNLRRRAEAAFAAADAMAAYLGKERPIRDGETHPKTATGREEE